MPQQLGAVNGAVPQQQEAEAQQEEVSSHQQEQVEQVMTNLAFLSLHHLRLHHPILKCCAMIAHLKF